MSKARGRSRVGRQKTPMAVGRKPRPDAPLAFVIMPFGVVFDQIYDRLFVPLLERAGYRVRRADTELHQRAIMREVIEGITTADLIWADLTGGNANVFYELGIAHGLKARTVLVAQRRDDIPFDLRGYKNHVYRVEFSSPPSLADDLSRELQPFLVAARRNEVLFGNPFSDFADASEGNGEVDKDEGGILDRMLEFQRRADEFLAALTLVTDVSERFTLRTVALTERLTVVPDGTDQLEHMVSVAGEIGALWNETADELERVLDDQLGPITLVVERGAKAAMVLANRGESDEETETALASLKELAATAAQASAGQTSLARLTRENLQYAAALRRPGMRLATIYDRFASNFDRIAALGGEAAVD